MHRITNLAAPGRLAIVEQTLKDDPYFRPKMRKMGKRAIAVKNRLNVRRRFNRLTMAVIKDLQSNGLDAVKLHQNEIIRRAYAICEFGKAAA